MKYSPFIYFLIVIFVSITLLTVYMQYNSSKNIKGLISGNENLLAEFSTDKDLRNIQSYILNIESKVRGVIVTGDTVHQEGVEDEVRMIEAIMNRLQQVSANDNTENLIDRLDSLLKIKISFSRQTLNVYYSSGKTAAEKMNSPRNVRQLTGDIRETIQDLETVRMERLAGITNKLDSNGRDAYLWGYIFLAFVLLTTITGFLFIINKLKQQQLLINELDASEKRAREAARIKENFMANMSHEIRTPMNAIIGFTNLLQKQPLDDLSRDYIRSIHTSGENLLTIINDILDLSKIEAGMMRIEETPFSVRELVHSVETMFRNKITEKDLALKTTVEPDVPGILVGDHIRLTQILANLLSNAIKFTSKGEIDIHVSGENKGNGRFTLNTEVRDTGIGIEKDKLSVIFDRFHQAEDSTTRKFGGTGLGLSIVKELVLIQGGEITAESEPGKGSVFRFSVPYKIKSGQYDREAGKADKAVASTDHRPVKILVAEDNAMNQKLLDYLFSAWQMEYVIAANGREAVEKLQQQHFDLVLMDIQMPEMDGYTATAIIRQELKSEIPVIAMTAHAMSGEKEKCLSYGMNDYLSKPIREDNLLALITRYTRAEPAVRLEDTGLQETDGQGGYKTIDLAYLRQISNGNKEFEKTVSAQFIEMIPGEISSLKKAYEKEDWQTMNQVAHNLKTTVSVMGLSDKLDPLLSVLEMAGKDSTETGRQLKELEEICLAALREAELFSRSL